MLCICSDILNKLINSENTSAMMLLKLNWQNESMCHIYLNSRADRADRTIPKTDWFKQDNKQTIGSGMHKLRMDWQLCFLSSSFCDI